MEASSTAMERRPLRIAFIGARGIGSAYSGIETYYEEVGSRLVSYGHEVLAYCRRHATPATADFRGVYCSLIEQWLNADAAAVIPGAGSYARTPLLK